MRLRVTGLIGVFSMLLLLASACVHPISKQLRNEAQKDKISFTTVLADPATGKGKTVLWGGRIVEATNLKEGTEIIVLETPLDFLGQPDSAETSRGRFIARSPEFLDPAIYSQDRKITLAGEVAGAEEKALGETTYRYPVIIIRELYLWEKPSPEDYPVAWPGPWGPYYGPFPYYY